MKKFYSLLLCVFSFGVTLFAFAGCSFLFGKDELIVTEVSTAQELQEGAMNISLQNDIDLGGEFFDPIRVHSFNGNGHTISNAIITTTSVKNSASFFSEVFDHVQDVTFKNITVSAENTSYAAIVLALPSSRYGYGDDKKNIKQVVFDNIRIEGCNIILNQNDYEGITYVGGVLGSGTASKSDAGDYNHVYSDESFKTVISNCTVSETEISVQGYKPERDGTYTIGPDIYAGGISGSGEDIKNCTSEYNTISVTSGQRYSEPYVGGITGALGEEANVFKCTVFGNTLKAHAGYYRHVSLINAYECGDIHLGGIFGSSEGDTSVSYCSVEENSFRAESVGGFYLGGIGGAISADVSQSRIVNNEFVGIGYLDGEDKSGDPWTRNIGGVSASSAEVTFSSIFTYGNRMTTTLSLDDVQTVDPTGSCVGFAKTTPEAVFMYCATGANEMSSGTTDEFATAALENVDQCYVTSETYGNARELPFINESDWFAEDQISMLLNLAGDNWTFTPGALPDLQ